jgi:hypothetical protein
MHILWVPNNDKMSFYVVKTASNVLFTRIFPVLKRTTARMSTAYGSSGIFTQALAMVLFKNFNISAEQSVMP